MYSKAKMSAPVKVCLIGAGPSGMSVLYQIAKLRDLGYAGSLPEVTCYEKQEDWGGAWNYTWRTGLDEFGESVHSSMYRDLWSNVPKEVMEYPDYSFDDHFGKAVPSFVPRAAMLSYLHGRWDKFSLRHKVAFRHSVHSVTFDSVTNKFSVSVRDLKNDRLMENQEFDYVVNCSGHFTVPNVPHFEGIEGFPGRLLHSHDLREWSEFTSKRMLVVGGSYSADDAALQLFKHGAASVICSYRTRPLGFKWPDTVSERRLVTEFEGSVVRFQDGSSAEIDGVILATGYLHHYPYLSDSLRLVGRNAFYPSNLYKCVLWLGGGNNRMLYIGAQNQCYSLPMFDVQALWVIKYICGDIKLADRDALLAEVQKWQERQCTLKDALDCVDFQTDCLVDLARECGYGGDMDSAHLFRDWVSHKQENILTVRDRRFVSRITGTVGAAPAVAHMANMDDSLETFLAN